MVHITGKKVILISSFATKIQLNRTFTIKRKVRTIFVIWKTRVKLEEEIYKASSFIIASSR